MSSYAFYQEPNGDYLVVDLSTADYYRSIGKPFALEGRATVMNRQQTLFMGGTRC